MFFKQIYRNAKVNRQENRLFFSSLIVTIVAFYTLLSLGEQDVIHFLRQMESDAVRKIMLLLPIVYVISLFFVFFLVYFAYRYQLERRRKELGLYLMLGMKRSSLFWMLLGETVWNSLASLVVGLPLSLLLTELISLTTIKLIGLGIVGHRFTFSLPALAGTMLGFLVVQLLAMLILSIYFTRQEPLQLLQSAAVDKQKLLKTEQGTLFFIVGCVSLIAAYLLGIFFFRQFEWLITGVIIVLGIAGTFALYRGIGAIIGRVIANKRQTRPGLFVFTSRQLQENVLSEYKTLAIASLLFVLAITCISFGIGEAASSRAANSRSVDVSLYGDEQTVRAFLEQKEHKKQLASYYPMYLAPMNLDYTDGHGHVMEQRPGAHDVSWAAFNEALLKVGATKEKVASLSANQEAFYVISDTSFNTLLKSIGKEPLILEKKQVAFYTRMVQPEENRLREKAIKAGAAIEIDGERFTFAPAVRQENLVADSGITLMNALIVPEHYYPLWTTKEEQLPFSWNVVLNEQRVAEKGLIGAIQQFEESLRISGIPYETYLSGIGRNLFYTVATSYLTIYLGLLFLVISNTVLSLKFLMQQRNSAYRYQNLLMIGGTTQTLIDSAIQQVRLFFTLVLGISLINSLFSIRTLFPSLVRLPQGVSMTTPILFTVIAFAVLLLLELIYIWIVERQTRKEMERLTIERSE